MRRSYITGKGFLRWKIWYTKQLPPFKTFIYNPGHTGIPVKRLQSSVAANGKNDYSRRRQWMC